MIRSFKFLMRPTRRQQIALSAMLADHCALYNAALQERRDAYRHPSKTRIKYGGQSAQLKEIRQADPEGQGRWSFNSQQATLRRLDKAFAAFFRRLKEGKKPGYPRFRPRARFNTVEFPQDGNGCRWDSASRLADPRVRLQGIGHVRVHQHRKVTGRVKTVSVKREGGRWYLILVCDQVPTKTVPATGAVVGIDMGVASYLTTSDGKHVPNPRYGKSAAEELAQAQRELDAFSRCKAKSRTKRHRNAASKVSRLYRRVARQRLDYAHKTALSLVRDYDLIAHEKLEIANMVKSPDPRPNPEQQGSFLLNGARAKAGLNRSISDVGWGVFLGILAFKAESAGRIVIPVNPRNTSRTCPQCEHVAKENRIRQEEFRCVRCAFTAHADVVGATNVLRAGLALYDTA
ncbi:RNA-guided endonuclease InsQ/TnpB family protein [Nocardiopsis sp. NPDC101807]|uniref:RNA-guided endonuclease InsQ/TnpB family protein n=1 Tax=Nocardiopsis sp. NPDC101807 TaxID=3364339 RepID=UPI0037FD0E15